MDTTISLNILFIVISIFIFFFGVTLTILLIYIILFLEKLHSFINIIKKESEKIGRDIENIREKIKSGENTLIKSGLYLFSFFKNHLKRSRK